MGAGRALLRNAIAIVEHDIVRHVSIVVRSACVVVVPATYDDTGVRLRYRVIRDDDMVSVVPQMDGSLGNTVYDIVLHSAGSTDVDSLYKATTGGSDVVYEIRQDVVTDAAVVAIDADP